MKTCFQIAECSLFSAQRYKKMPISANYSRIICANGVKKAR